MAYFWINDNSLLSWVGFFSSRIDFKLQRTSAFHFIFLVSWSGGWDIASLVTEVKSIDLESVIRSSSHCLICLSLYNAEHVSYFPSVFWTHNHHSTPCSVGTRHLQATFPWLPFWLASCWHLPVGGPGKKKEAMASSSLNMVLSGPWWFSAPGTALFYFSVCSPSWGHAPSVDLTVAIGQAYRLIGFIQISGISNIWTLLLFLFANPAPLPCPILSNLSSPFK